MPAFLLDPANLLALQAKLASLEWLTPGERIVRADKAGEGNMNCTLRVSTSNRTLIVKQSRPWVEKYPQIPAPEDRAVMEAAFYHLASSDPDLAAAMPHLLGSSEPDRLLALADLGESARDFSFLYSGQHLSSSEIQTLAAWLHRLHHSFQPGQFPRNEKMRALNHEYIFVQPLTIPNDFPSEYKSRVRELGDMYLGDGPSLLHGDYFPGSWLRTDSGLKIIDPEFAFFGPPEFDAGVWYAHLHLAMHPDPAIVLHRTPWCDPRLTRQFAGVEIMRRILGVAQLPLRASEQEKRALLELSKEFVLA